MALEQALETVAMNQAEVSMAVHGLEQQVTKLADAVSGLSEAIRGPQNEPGKGLLSRVERHDDRVRLRGKIILALTITLCSGGIIWFIGQVIAPAIKP